MTITDQDIKKDFDQFKNDAFGILLFGSYMRGDMTSRSDVDVCIVKPANEGLLRDVNRKLGGKYDIKIFEKLPLYIQIEIIREHVLVYGNEVDLSAYFYRFRKLWADMVPRIRDNQFTSVHERMTIRRKWLHDKKAIS